MQRELAEILDMLACQRPLILFLDDMHWGDHASIAALAYLARPLLPDRLLLLAAYRPEDAALQQHPVHAQAVGGVRPAYLQERVGEGTQPIRHVR